MARDGEAARPPSTSPASILLLGAGELGKELAIAAQRLGLHVIAADRYEGAPAMQVADLAEVLSLMDATALEGVIRTHRPDLIVPEVEALRTDTLAELEREGFQVVPTAHAASLVADREALRHVARRLGLRTPDSRVAPSLEALHEACDAIGYPVVVKPRVSSSGRGHSVVPGASRVERAWEFAHEEVGEGDGVIVEEYIQFEMEITLLGVRDRAGGTRFLPPIAHRQERGGYRESWTPVPIASGRLSELRSMGEKLLAELGGAGLAGFEFLISDGELVFSEASLGPHDTGMVTLASQDLSQFDLHLRAILDLPAPTIRDLGPAASAVILADREGRVAGYRGLDKALQIDTAQIHIFGKPEARPFRRMGVALASGDTAEEARARALEAAARVSVVYA